MSGRAMLAILFMTMTSGIPPTDSAGAARALTSGVDLKALDRSARPQDDFFQFANGGWLDSTEIPSIYSGYSVYHQVNERTEEALRKIIEESAAHPGPAGSESQQVGDLFASWMDEETINRLGVEAIRPELSIVDAITDRKSLAEAFARLSRLGITAPYGLSIYPDLKNSSVNAAYFSQDGITLPDRDYYLDTTNANFNKAREALPGYIRSLLVAAGRDSVTADSAARTIVAMETAMATAQWDKVKNRDTEAGYNPFPVSGLKQFGENFDWNITLSSLGIDSADTLIIRQPDYFKAMDALVGARSIEEWKNYLTFRVMDDRADQLDSLTAAIRFDFRNRTLSGQKEERQRWKRGVSLVDNLLGEAVGKLYVAGYFPPAAKAKMQELVGNVLVTLDESLNSLEWMTPETRVKAREKLSKFTAKIGYPDVWRDYSTLKIVRGDHAGNLRRAREWEHNRQVKKVGQPVDRTEWSMTPQTVNAYYSPTKNEVVFPAARLQPPFFQLEADDAINYGAVGGVIGHEISHGFDDQGSRFDGNGNMANWWTDLDRARFEERTKALVAQYNAFSPIEGMTVNGAFTLGENIGDLSGVAMAYRAYIVSLKGQEPPVIDGFTGPQRFFIGYAMSRKGKSSDAETIRRLASDSHSPLKYRVIGPYRNIDAFHEAFATKPGDGMWLAPEERVRIW